MRIVKLCRVCFVATIATLATLSSSQASHAGTWEITCTATNTDSGLSVQGATPLSFAFSERTALSALTGISGVTSGTVVGQAQASYSSGTWTFQWHPDNSTDWPSDYKVKSMLMKGFTASAANGTGTVSVSVGGTTQVSVTLPNSASAVVEQTPASITTTTPDTNLTVVTTTFSRHNASAITSGWMESRSSTVTTVRSYAAAYFPAHYSTPADVILTFSPANVSVSADSSFSSSSSSGSCVGMTTAAELYSGE